RVGPTPVGRDKPGPRKAAGSAGCGSLWGRLYAGQRCFDESRALAPPPSAGINPAPQRRSAWLVNSCGAGFMPASGASASARVLGPAPVGRDKPGPTTALGLVGEFLDALLYAGQRCFGERPSVGPR